MTLPSLSWVRKVPMKPSAALQLGLDKPAPVRFGQWLVNFVQGDLGESLRYNIPVKDLVVQALPITLNLAMWAVLLALATAVITGVFSAAYSNRWWGKGMRVLSQLGMAVPQFWVGILLIQLFAVAAPLACRGYSNWQSLILPIVTLALPLCCAHQHGASRPWGRPQF